MYQGSIIKCFIILELCFKYYYAIEAESTCDKVQKFGCDNHSILNYQRSLNWEETDLKQFKLWLKLIINVEYPVQCKISKSKKKKKKNNDDQIENKPLRGPYPCNENNSNLVVYKGSKNNQDKPHGLGKMFKIKSPIKNNSNTIRHQYCYNMLSNIKSIRGKFVNGILHGKATIKYTNNAYMDGTFINGILQGLIRRFDKNNVFEMVGNYLDGVPHGPFWIGDYFQEKFILVHFDKGHPINQNVLTLNIKTMNGLLGKMVNNGSYLELDQEISAPRIAESKCMKVIDILSKNKDLSSKNPRALYELDSYLEYLPEYQILLGRNCTLYY